MTEWETSWVHHKEGLYILIKARFEESLDGMPRPYSRICGYLQQIPDNQLNQWRIMLPTKAGNVKEIEPTIHFWDVDAAMNYLLQVA